MCYPVAPRTSTITPLHTPATRGRRLPAAQLEPRQSCSSPRQSAVFTSGRLSRCSSIAIRFPSPALSTGEVRGCRRNPPNPGPLRRRLVTAPTPSPPTPPPRRAHSHHHRPPAPPSRCSPAQPVAHDAGSADGGGGARRRALLVGATSPR